MEKPAFNKNDKQFHFNEVRGLLTEVNDGEKYCSITLELGHENTRQVNIVLKKAQFDAVMSPFSVGEKISVKYYLVSRFKNSRWYTSANFLEIKKES